jgi:hypothetical protein
MFALARETEQFLASLPAEFSKREFDEARKALFGKHPLSLQTCRDYGFVVVVRTEPASYRKIETVWTDTKGRQWDIDEITMMDRFVVARLFNCPDYTDRWASVYSLPNKEVEVEHPCERNIFRFDVEKFKRFLRENA